MSNVFLHDSPALRAFAERARKLNVPEVYQSLAAETQLLRDYYNLAQWRDSEFAQMRNAYPRQNIFANHQDMQSVYSCGVANPLTRLFGFPP